MSAKNVRKDQALLNSLGIKQPLSTMTKPTKVDRLLGDSATNKLNDDSFFQPETGKLTFKSHLKPDERNAVRKVASGVSEELGLKLLAPTPGSKLLMKHLTRDAKADEKKDKTKDELIKLEKERVRQNQSGAQRLLLESKITQNSKSAPKLGRGMSSGFINFDLAPKPKTSKEAAIQALKGKSIAKVDPNYVMKRKRSIDDLESANQKVAKKLKDDDKEEMVDKTANKKEVKTFRSFTGEIIGK